MKIANKFTSVFLLFTLLITALFFFGGLQSQNRHFKSIAQEHINEVRASFFSMQERDSQMLFSTLEVIVKDPFMKTIYKEKNRDKLYTYVQPLFQDLRAKYGITQFNFILPDGRIFLRMQNKALFGDLIKRTSFQRAKETRGPAWELELGKTAFALRTVVPYYMGKELMGYLELGEGIGHFLDILKKETSTEFGILADKEYLDRGDWKSVRETSGLRDNWEDLKRQLVLKSTIEGEIAARCFTEANLERVKKGESIFNQIQARDKTFMCGGFELKDRGGRHIGAVLSVVEITEQVAIAEMANRSTLWISVFFFVATFTVGILVSRSLSRPILKLSEVAREVGKGNLDQKLEISSGDEIGQLGIIFNGMIEKRKATEEEREKLIRELKDALSNVKTLKGLLPICAWCKRIRDDGGYWRKVEAYLEEHSEASFTHGICPECLKGVNPEIFDAALKSNAESRKMAERRLSERRPFSGTFKSVSHINLKECKRTPLNASIKNISEGGICILTDHSILPGDLVIFDDGVKERSGIVKWAKAPDAENKLFEAGIKFL